ncbi:MAG: L,D-transpeptidase [Nitrospira sp.]|nr:MAG: L,D-transpeptidase [Nitrospira sp.]
MRTHLILVSTIILLSAGSEAESARKYRDLCSIVYPSDATIEWECRTLRAGESLEKLFGEHWIDVVRFNRIDRRHAEAGRSIKVPKQLYDLQAFTPLPLSYPTAELDEQFVLIDLSEQFLGAYEYGSLRFAMPIASGEVKNPTPVGEFRLTAAHRAHESCLYMIEGTNRPYPMNYALRFYINREGVSYWIHGRDVPGYPASHGCIGLYDELMQKEEYGIPNEPELNDAKRLFEWVLGGEAEDDRLIQLPQGPRVYITGRTPR